MKRFNVWPVSAIAVCCLWISASAAGQGAPAKLWDLAQNNKAVHRFSTLFTAHDVQKYLSSDAGIDKAIEWCRQTAVTKVYIEEFRDGYQAERATILRAKDKFQVAGIDVSGCVTTTKLGKPSTHWRDTISCYTDQATQEKLQGIFEYAAGLFDEIMIDDFWFTNCECAQCDAARLSKTVTVGQHTFPVSGDSWADYRCELMLRISQERLLAAAK